MRASILLSLAALVCGVFATAVDRRQFPAGVVGGSILHIGACFRIELGALSINLLGVSLCVQACLAADVALSHKTTFDGHSFHCTPPAPNPSARARRALVETTHQEPGLCPAGKTACHLGLFLPSTTSSSAGFECVDIELELANCGTCGHDCTRAKGVADVMCQRGACRALSCRPGFRLDPHDRASCTPKRSRSLSGSSTPTLSHPSS